MAQKGQNFGPFGFEFGGFGHFGHFGPKTTILVPKSARARGVRGVLPRHPILDGGGGPPHPPPGYTTKGRAPPRGHGTPTGHPRDHGTTGPRDTLDLRTLGGTGKMVPNGTFLAPFWHRFLAPEQAK